MDREVGETILKTSFRRLSIGTSTLVSLICASGTGGECGRREGVMQVYCYLILFTWFIGSAEKVLPPATGNEEQCQWKYPDDWLIVSVQHWPK